MKVRILRPGLEDLMSAQGFYERRAPGVGSYFLQVFFAEIDSLARCGGVHRQQFGLHRLLVKKFPYAVYYRIVGDEAVVFRVLDCRRNPDWIRQALKVEEPQ